MRELLVLSSGLLATFGFLVAMFDPKCFCELMPSLTCDHCQEVGYMSNLTRLINKVRTQLDKKLLRK